MRIMDNIYMLSGLPYGQGGNVYGINYGKGIILIDSGRDEAALSTFLENIEYHGLSKLPVTHLLLNNNPPPEYSEGGIVLDIPNQDEMMRTEIMLWQFLGEW